MYCHVCGSELQPIVTDLPFKLGDSSIVILKALPVLQCSNCPEYLIEDAVMERVDEVLQKADRAVELEIVRFAA